ncbi:hypothetical protein PENTCL1PPCAC_12357, partial [Pristionchus entomophagus]
GQVTRSREPRCGWRIAYRPRPSQLLFTGHTTWLCWQLTTNSRRLPLFLSLSSNETLYQSSQSTPRTDHI